MTESGLLVDPGSGGWRPSVTTVCGEMACAPDSPGEIPTHKPGVPSAPCFSMGPLYTRGPILCPPGSASAAARKNLSRSRDEASHLG